MGGGGTNTTTTTSGSSDPQFKSTLDQLLKGVSTAYTAGPTYTPPGATTQQGWADSLTAANNPAYQQGISGALSNFNGLQGTGGLTSGQWGNLNDTNSLASQYGQMANDPASTQAGRNLINSVLTNTNAAFNNSGLFGSDNNQTAAAQGLTQGLGELQQGYLSGQGSTLSNAFNMGQQGVSNQASISQLLPALYQAGQLPAGTESAVGAQQDTAAQNAANKNLTLLGQLSSILNGTAPSVGQTTTQTTPAPSTLQSLLGLGIGLL